MIQHIAPHSYSPEFAPRAPRIGDLWLRYEGGRILMVANGQDFSLPQFDEQTLPKGCVTPPEAADEPNKLEEQGTQAGAHKEAAAKETAPLARFVYLFTIDGKAAFLDLSSEAFTAKECEEAGLAFHQLSVLRTISPLWAGFAGATGRHLEMWYKANRFCGVCGNAHSHSRRERALVCGVCGNTRYPRISPAVIVGVIDGERLLLTRYNGREYAKYALIAGFVEAGEDFEATVKREVREEAGVDVTNIRYFASQPWGFSGGLLAGFFADLSGDAAIHHDEEELLEALWVERDALFTGDLYDENTISLTYAMMAAFHKGEEPV